MYVSTESLLFTLHGILLQAELLYLLNLLLSSLINEQIWAISLLLQCKIHITFSQLYIFIHKGYKAYFEIKNSCLYHSLASILQLGFRSIFIFFFGKIQKITTRNLQKSFKYNCLLYIF